MSERDREADRLRALAQATEDVRPSDGFADAVMAALSVDAGTDEVDVWSGRSPCGRDVDERLARTAAASAELDADPALGDAVMATVDPIEGALARAARSTAELSPDGDLAGAVMRAVRADASRTPWPYAVVRSARAALVAASVAAAASVALSLYTQRELDADVMAAVETVEVAE